MKSPKGVFVGVATEAEHGLGSAPLFFPATSRRDPFAERPTLGAANVGAVLGATTANGDPVIDHLRGATAKAGALPRATSGYARA